MAFNIKKAKEIHKKYPNKKWTQCVKEAGVLGAVKKKTTTVAGINKKRKPKASSKPRVIIEVKRPLKKKTTPVAHGHHKGTAILKEINHLEQLRAKCKDQGGKRMYQHFINKEHDKLDRLTKKRT